MNFIGGVVAIFLLVLALAALGSWPVMVLWGAVADDFGIPTIGLGTAWQLSALTALLFKSGASVSS